jgi:hypothetical protein
MSRKGLSLEAKQKRIEYHINTRTSPNNLFYIDGFDWKYISFHPVVDETWWFEKFNETPEICTSADFYWQFDEDVAFLEISTRKYPKFITETYINENFFARWNGGRKDGLLNLHALVLDDLIYSHTVERVMKKFWEFHQKMDLFETFYLKKESKILE